MNKKKERNRTLYPIIKKQKYGTKKRRGARQISPTMKKQGK